MNQYNSHRQQIQLRHPLVCKLGEQTLSLRALSPTRFFLHSDKTIDVSEHRNIVAIALAGDQALSFDLNLDKKLSPHDIVLKADTQEERMKLTDLLHRIRKNQHIDICNEEDVESSDKDNGLNRLQLRPKSLPELNWQDIDCRSCFLGQQFSLPLLITGMTGGIDRAREINKNLALTAAQYKIPMGVGSQRIAIENPEHRDIFRLKHEVSDLFLIGNLGIGQLVTSNNPAAFAQAAVDMIDADALAIHVNVLQELIQEEGDRNFRGLFTCIESVCQSLSVPVVVKEVGCGIDHQTAKQLVDCGVKAIDVGGKGGTSWGYIEGLRSSSRITLSIAESFRDWGISTADSLRQVKQATKNIDIIATGGMRDGLMAAKALALGANMVGIGLPLLKAALIGQEEVANTLEMFARGLKTAMLCTGSSTLEDLQTKVYDPSEGENLGI